MLPSASAAKNTALMPKSGDLVASAVAMAAVVRPPGELGVRFVRLPAKTPPAVKSGAPARGKPCASMTVIVPSPALPFGAFANQGRPKPLLNEIPNGRLTDGRSAVTAAGFLRIQEVRTLRRVQNDLPSNCAGLPTTGGEGWRDGDEPSTHVD